MKKLLFVAAAAFAAACTKEEAAPKPPTEPGTPPPAAEPAKPPPPQEISITSKSTEAAEAFKKGRELMENFRPAEAVEHFKKSIELDADFALAHAFLGVATPGSEGLAHIEKGMSLAAALPEGERLEVEHALAQRKGEDEKARELLKKIVEVAPTDWRAQTFWGGQLYGERKYDEAIAALKKATELNPNAGAAWNMLGYASLMSNKNDDAIAAFKRYIDSNNEPNAHDSLAEALMKAGQFEEAEAEFRKATELNAQFWFGWQGVAYTRAFRGDWTGAKEALTKAKEAAPRPIDKLQADEMHAWFMIAAGQSAHAMKALDALDKEAEAQNSPVWPGAALVRSFAQHEAGKYKDALKSAQAATERAEKASPGMGQVATRRIALLARLLSEARMNKPADAEKTLAELQAEAAKAPSNAQLQSNVHFGQGAVAMAKGDAKGAADHLGRCIPEDAYCHWMHAMAMEKAGDKAGADAMRESLRAANLRDPVYLYVRGKLGGGAPTAPAAAAPTQ